nr:MAG TPA: hypothetical protein [Caudoviricetes sp.]
MDNIFRKNSCYLILLFVKQKMPMSTLLIGIFFINL